MAESLLFASSEDKIYFVEYIHFQTLARLNRTVLQPDIRNGVRDKSLGPPLY